MPIETCIDRSGEARQLVTLHAEISGERLDSARSALAKALGAGAVGTPDETGMLEVEVPATSHEGAVVAVRDAVAAAGVDDQFTFPETTGTGFQPPWRRASEGQAPAQDEPPHLERGGAREEQPAPQDPPGRLQREF